MKDTYYVAGIGREMITMAGIEKQTVKVPKNGIDGHIEIPVEKICEPCEKWNLYDKENEEYYCPRCERRFYCGG